MRNAILKNEQEHKNHVAQKLVYCNQRFAHSKYFMRITATFHPKFLSSSGKVNLLCKKLSSMNHIIFGDDLFTTKAVFPWRCSTETAGKETCEKASQRQRNLL
jgi:hypothetical protein